MTQVKICCISSIEEAQAALAHGASALGLVSEMPSGPGVINESLIAEITASIPADVSTFLLTSKTNAQEIIAQQTRCKTNTLQICDRVSEKDLQTIRMALPSVRIVQVIHVADELSVTDARASAAFVDALLLDSGNASLAVKQLGGTGRTHDWTLSAKIVSEVAIPVYLAGGLNSDNVVDAIRCVQPFGVDVCSGVRTDGELDERKLASFTRAVHASASAFD